VPLLYGATILGDGSVVVILDPNGLASKLGRAADQAGRDDLEAKLADSDDGLQSFVLFRAGEGALKAVPLRLVTRLEELEASSIEWANGAAVVQYRGALTPVMHTAGDHAFATEGKQPLLMFTHRGAAFGLAVDEIVDVVHEKMNIELATDRPGIIGAAVMRGKATEIVDVGFYLEQASASWNDRRGSKYGKGKLLLVDPSDFTRHMLAPLLEAAGYETCAVNSFDAAWRLNEKGFGVDAILTDVDADPAAASAFAERAAQDPRWGQVARLSLSDTHDSDAFGGEVVAKSDRNGLLAVLATLVRNKERAA
jgi:two-component system chemotaxis sensor kinase CheA